MTARLRLSTYRCGHVARRADTLYLGTVRFLPRGVRKAEYAARGYFDVWFPLLAPSPELVKRFLRSAEGERRAFAAAYEKEMARTDPRQAIELVARLARRTPLALGCYCEDETRCHRSLLAQLVRAAARS